MAIIPTDRGRDADRRRSRGKRRQQRINPFSFSGIKLSSFDSPVPRISHDRSLSLSIVGIVKHRKKPEEEL